MSDHDSEPGFAADLWRRPAVRRIGGLLLGGATIFANWRVFDAAFSGVTSPPFGARRVRFDHAPELFVGLFLVRLVVALACDGLVLALVRDWSRRRGVARAPTEPRR
jgi:hypothetical protein